jgi:DNA-binding winged helix-turn-helix (wHTH) protein
LLSRNSRDVGLGWSVPLRFQFGDMILDAQRRELRSGQRSIAIEPLAFDLLAFLIQHRDRVVSRDDLLAGVWGGRVVSDSAIGARINAARRAINDDGEQQRWIRTFARKGFRFIGDVSEEGLSEAPANAADCMPPMHTCHGQNITFCRTQDGVNLAVASVGRGPVLVRPSHWINCLQCPNQAQSTALLVHEAHRPAVRPYRKNVLVRRHLRGFHNVFSSSHLPPPRTRSSL